MGEGRGTKKEMKKKCCLQLKYYWIILTCKIERKSIKDTRITFLLSSSDLRKQIWESKLHKGKKILFFFFFKHSVSSLQHSNNFLAIIMSSFIPHMIQHSLKLQECIDYEATCDLRHIIQRHLFQVTQLLRHTLQQENSCRPRIRFWVLVLG